MTSSEGILLKSQAPTQEHPAQSAADANPSGPFITGISGACSASPEKIELRTFRLYVNIGVSQLSEVNLRAGDFNFRASTQSAYSRG